jgi:hypothetical protein
MIIGVFVGFLCIFLLGILIFKGLTARSLYKSVGIKRLINTSSACALRESVIILLSVFCNVC